MNRLGTSLIAAGAFALAAPAAAQADSLIYRDGHNVVRENTDGTKKQVLAEGTSEMPFFLPSGDDNGNVLAFRSYDSYSKEMHWFGADGKHVENVMPWKIGGGANGGPTFARLRGDGKQVVYNYIYNPGFFSDKPLSPHMAIVDPLAPGNPVSPTIDQDYILSSTWRGDQLIITDTVDAWAEIPGQPLHFQSWLTLNGAASIDFAEVSRDGSRAAIWASDTTITIVDMGPGTPPTNVPVNSCEILTDGPDKGGGALVRIALSPDGKRIAWGDDAGLHIGEIGTVAGGKCALQDERIVSSTGGSPSFSTYTITDKPATPPPATPGTPGAPTTPGTPSGPGATPGSPATPSTPAAVSFSTVKKLTLALLKKGLSVKVTVPGPAKVSVKVAQGRKTIATGKGTAKKKGAVNVKLTKPKAAVLKKLRRKKVTVKVTVTPSGGKAATASRTYTVR